MALKIWKWLFPKVLAFSADNLKMIFSGLLKMKQAANFQMFSIFTPYGGTAPLNIGGRPGP
jgi:hypothetical protein